MAISSVKTLPKQTYEIEIRIPWDEIKSSYEEVLNKIKSETELAGFRKGKAPKKLVEKNIDKAKVYQEVIKNVIPKSYSEALVTHKLTPVIPPKLEILKAKENDEWVVKVTIALKPVISLKNYKERIRDLKKAKVKIWTPGQDKKKEENHKLLLNEIVEALLAEVELELSDILIDQEKNRLLADLIDQTRQLGITIEQYLISKGKTSEILQEEYQKQAIKNLSLEFILAAIADKENIITTSKDIDDLINKVEKEDERQRLRKDSYYLAHLIRQQKTLDFLNNL